MRILTAIAAMSLNRVIGNGKPGPVTQKLVARYRALTKMSGEPIYD